MRKNSLNFYAGYESGWELEKLNLGASVNGKPTVSKTVTAGSSPAAPVITGWQKGFWI